MAKEWILNQAMNRWGLNKKKSVGPVSEHIRKCSPRNIREWEEYYYSNVYPHEHLVELGQRLYVKITEVVRCEVEEVTEEDCISYIQDVVLRRTFEGYRNEIDTVYGQLQEALGIKITSAPDEWDRLYNVDFSIAAGEHFVGIQIKPVTFNNMPDFHKWEEVQRATHNKFAKKYGGKVFTVFSTKEGGKKIIVNKEVISKLNEEIRRLSE